MDGLRTRDLVKATGVALVALAIVSLLATMVAQAHCIRMQTLLRQDAHHVHAAHHRRTDSPATPQQSRTDECCGVLCTAAGWLVRPPLAAPAVIGSGFTMMPFQGADATGAVRKRPVLPLGSRAPPVLA